jgi:PAS domain-containing protein
MVHQRLLGTAEALQKIIDIIPAPVIVKDSAHRCVRVNDAGVALLEQAFCLMELGCDEMQGYLSGHPMPGQGVL